MSCVREFILPKANGLCGKFVGYPLHHYVLPCYGIECFVSCSYGAQQTWEESQVSYYTFDYRKEYIWEDRSVIKMNYVMP